MCQSQENLKTDWRLDGKPDRRADKLCYRTLLQIPTSTGSPIKLIDKARFITSSLSNNVAEEIHEINCKDCECFLQCKSIKESLIKYKDYSNKPDKELIKQFKNTFRFFNNDINRFILLLRKGVYPYEYIDESEKFNETSLSEKENFVAT